MSELCFRIIPNPANPGGPLFPRSPLNPCDPCNPGKIEIAYKYSLHFKFN